MVPGTIQAEDYDLGGEGVAYHDTTPGNEGGVYRQDDVDIEQTAGLATPNVCGIQDGEYLTYTVNVTEAGAYTVTARVASPNGARRIDLSVDGRFETTLLVPSTGSFDMYGSATSPIVCWDRWDPVGGWVGSCDPVPISLSAGTHTLKLTFQGDGQNLDWIELTRSARITPTPTRTPPVGPTPYKPLMIPGTIQAEDYDLGGEGVAYHDTTPGNEGGVYRQDDVDIEQTAGLATPNVGWIRDGEYLTYTANVATPGAYTMTARVASPNTGRSGALSVDGSSPVTFMVPNTGSYAAFQTVSLAVTLPAGTHTLKLAFVGDGQNLDWITFVPFTPTPTPPLGSPTLSMPGTIPGMIEAEDYNAGGEGVAYHDTTPGNSGGAYRQDDVDIETAGGVTNVGWIRDGEWLKYAVNVRLTGEYDVVFRVSSPQSNTQIKLLVDGVTATTFTVPNTGNFETYTNVTQKVRLTGGPHVLRLTFSGYHNIDWIAFAGATVTPICTQPPPPTADFSANRTSGPAPLAVQFTDRSTWSAPGPCTFGTWGWNFGDGTTVTDARNPVHTYTSAGTYAVNLTVRNSGGTDSEMKAGFITVTAAVAAVPEGTVPPADIDGDGLYDDVNGNGRPDFGDVVLYFNQMAWIAANEPLEAFDYNKNGRIDFADVARLFTTL